MKMETTKKENQNVRCSDCREEFSGCSIKDILSSARCGRDGGQLRDSCKATLRSDGKNLFKVVPVETSKPKKKIDKKDE